MVPAYLDCFHTKDLNFKKGTVHVDRMLQDMTLALDKSSQFEVAHVWPRDYGLIGVVTYLPGMVRPGEVKFRR